MDKRTSSSSSSSSSSSNKRKKSSGSGPTPTRKGTGKEEEAGGKSLVGATSLHHDEKDETEDIEETKSLRPSSDNADLMPIKGYLGDLYTSLLNHGSGSNPFPKVTLLFCSIYGVEELLFCKNRPRYQYNGNTHAEKALIDELKKNTVVTESKNPSYSGPDPVITVYMNNSPCSEKDHDCKKKLKTFLKEYKRVRMTIYITSIHNVNRESCKRKSHSHQVSDEKHYESSAELWNLMQHDRCQISAYSKDVWEKLFDLDDESKKPLERYDKLLDQKHDTSREDADKLIGEDLYYIGKEILQMLYKVCSDKPHTENAKITCLICNINVQGSNIKLAKYDKEDQHAEELLLKELGEMDVGDERLTITIFMNDIPCSLPTHNCANGMIKYLEGKKNLDLTLYVTRIYEVAQEYCATHRHSNMCRLQDTDHSFVLKELQRRRCTIEAPCKKAWGELLSIMNIGEEDQIFHEFWRKYSIKESKDDRSRKGEDKRIRSYLNETFKK